MNQSLYLILFILLFLNLFSMKSYVFMMILWLEILILYFIFMMCTNSVIFSNMPGIMMIFTLSMAVCEAAVALATLVLLSRNPSSLLIKSMNPLKC